MISVVFSPSWVLPTLELVALTMKKEVWYESSTIAMLEISNRRRKKKKREAAMSESERLPHDVVYDILTRLAVKSLMRFRCVSKSCNSIIINPIFSSTHLDRAKSLSNKNGYLLYLDDASENPPYRRELCMVVYNTLTKISRFQIPFSHVNIAGFYDGMFCLQNNRNNELYLEPKH